MFTDWLSEQRDRDDPIGDLARDMLDDSYWPSTCESLSGLLTYLAHRGACEGAIRALTQAWGRFLEESNHGDP